MADVVKVLPYCPSPTMGLGSYSSFAFTASISENILLRNFKTLLLIPPLLLAHTRARKQLHGIAICSMSTT